VIDVPCVVFAGGKSSRMGEDKALLPFSSHETLTEFQLHRLNKIFTKTYVSCKDKSKFNFEALFIEDVKTQSVYAPTPGFIATFKELKEDSFFAISVDSPFIGEKEIKRLFSRDNPSLDATIARSPSGIQPMCGIYHRSLLEKFEQMLREGNHKLVNALKNSNTKFVEFDDDRPFLNLNHPHEYEEAKLRLNI